MGKKSKADSGGVRRPRRQRTKVQHYTDDIPGTFTKKKKRRRSDDSESSVSESDDDSGHHPQINDQRRTIHFDEFASLAGASAAAAKNTKRKRPGKTATEPATTTTTSNNSTKKSQQKPQQRKLLEMPATSPPKTTMLPHTASVAPILPLATTCPLARHSLAQKYHVIFGRGLGVPQPPSTPEWNLLEQHDFHFPEDYLEVKVACTPASEDEDPRITLAPVLQNGPWPVCRVVTSVCSYLNWMAVGDSAGFILVFARGPSAVKPLTRLDTSASKREHGRQRQLQNEVELRCRNKPELLEKRSPFWATAKTPNAIQCMTWNHDLILVLTPQEIEALQLTVANSSFEACVAKPSTSKGGNQHCKILWTLPVATVGGLRRNGSKSLLTGGELVGSYLELQKKGTMVIWNTWGVAVAKDSSKTAAEDSTSAESEIAKEIFSAEDDWPLLLMRDPTKEPTNSEAPEFIRIIPFQRHEEEEKSPPFPIKRSPGRPPKKKPKAKIPVSKSEFVWTENSKCHAVIWDNRAYKGDRLVVAYSSTPTISASDAQVQLALLKLTDDISYEEPTSVSTRSKPQFAKLFQQIAVPLLGSARNVANVPEVTLCQSTKGTYTLVAGSRGIRVYQTETMTLLRVYGENVSLHGKTMVWKSCFVLDNRLQQQLYQQQQQSERTGSQAAHDIAVGNEDEGKSKTVVCQNRQGFVWIEQENPLAALLGTKDSCSHDDGKSITRGRSSMHRIRVSAPTDEHDDDDDEDDESHFLHQAWIVGIPHPFRGPKEMQETLYFWQGVEKRPLFTLPLPHHSGGVQDIFPLGAPGSSSNNSSRADGMRLRLMVATVHGECMQLAPSVKSDFAGKMYNPGYFVVQDNVDYIEDEDELDKVMVQVPEERESEEEGAVVAPIGAELGGDIVDEELQEAIRLSLLESQVKSKAANGNGSDEEDDENDSAIVVVRDSFGDNDDNEMVIPCEPEPFLRKKLLPDFESDTMITLSDVADGDIFAKDAEFASEVLSILPQSNAAQERWEKQKGIVPPNSFLTTEVSVSRPLIPSTNGTIDAASSFPGKTVGRGKRTKAGNLEVLMKSSIDPEFRRYMTDRALCWADGFGASLQGDAWDHAIFEVTGSKKTRSRLSPYKQEAMAIQQEVAIQREVCDGSEETAAVSCKNTVENATGDRNSACTTTKALSLRIPESSETDVEKEIAMELLQLSPRPTASALPRDALPDIDIESCKLLKNPHELPNRPNCVDLGGVEVAIIELKDYSGIAEQYSCTGTVEIPLTLEDCGLAAEGEEANTNQEQDKKDEARTSRPMGGEDDTTEKQLKESKEGEVKDDLGKVAVQDASKIIEEASKEDLCTACQGRMVTHICGKRALPIDFEAIARAEKERKEREEEEKKRLKIEKRKQADAKRREAKKLKKEKEKRAKLEKEAELRKLREAKIAEARANMANIRDCLEKGSSPQLNGVSEVPGRNWEEERIELPKVANASQNAGGADAIHFAIADAWKEHAEKFNAKTESDATENGECGGPPIESDASQLNKFVASQPNTLETLASMVEAASTEVENRIQSPKQRCVVGLNGTPNTPGNAAATAGQQHLVQHGFFSSQDGSSTSAAMIARRNQVLNSYHAMEAGEAGAPVARVVDLSNQSQATLATSRETGAHSFQISPINHSHRDLGQPNLSVFQRHADGSAPAAVPRPSHPYFGYTRISTHFRPRVNLGSYSTSTVFTAYQRQPQPQAAPTRTESQAPSHSPAVAASRDYYFPASQPEAAAAAAAAAATHESTVNPASSTGLWVHPSQALAPARALPGTMLVQPQLGPALAPAAGHMPAPAATHVSRGESAAHYRHRLRGVQQAAGSAPGAPLNQHVNSVVYKNTTTTTNP